MTPRNVVEKSYSKKLDAIDVGRYEDSARFVEKQGRGVGAYMVVRIRDVSSEHFWILIAIFSKIFRNI